MAVEERWLLRRETRHLKAPAELGSAAGAMRSCVSKVQSPSSVEPATGSFLEEV